MKHVLESDQAWVDDKRRRRMEKIDSMPPELRELIHAYGACVVNSFVDCGVVKPKHIRHLVETVLDEFSPTRGAFSNQGLRNNHETETKDGVTPTSA